MSRIKIQKNVPLPPKPEPIPDLPLAQMVVGDSILVKDVSDKMKNAIRMRLIRYQNSNPPVVFSMRTVKDGEVRIFRIEDK